MRLDDIIEIYELISILDVVKSNDLIDALFNVKATSINPDVERSVTITIKDKIIK